MRPLRVIPAFLLSLLCGCQSVEPMPIIAAAPAPSAAEQSARSRTLYLSVIEELIKSGKAHAALAHLDEFERSFGEGPPSRKLRADAWLALEDLARAEAGYRSILGTALDGDGQHGLGRIAATRGAWDVATRHFEGAVREQPTNSRFLNDLGCSLFRLGRLDAAEFTLRQAHELAPKDEEIVENILVVLARRGGADRLDEVFPDLTAERDMLRARLAAYGNTAP